MNELIGLVVATKKRVKKHADEFELNQRVFDIRYGFGEVVLLDYKNDIIMARYPYHNSLVDIEYDTDDMVLLSNKEYKLEEVEEEMSKEEQISDYIGLFGRFYDGNDNLVGIAKLREYRPDLEKPVSAGNGLYFKRFEPLTNEEFRILLKEEE